MLFKQKIFAVIMSLVLLILIVELVRRKKLREEYSFLWIITAFGILVLVIWYDVLVWLSKIIGAVAPTSTLFVFSILFIMMILIHFSIKVSELTEHIKDLAQEITIIKSELNKKNE